jgi:hypothetical protein
MSVSPELIHARRKSDKQIFIEKTITKLTIEVRELGFRLGCREIYGENTPDYYRKKDHHRGLLNKLYALQKKA